jgi:hypothetical protein
MKRKIFNYIFLITILLGPFVQAERPPVSKAVGVFFATGVGARFPVGQFANSSNLGYGLLVDFSYTDSDNLPFFIFARFGYEQFPGSQDYYQETDYSNYSTTIVPISLGARYYFPPLVESAVLLIPVVEASVSYSYFHILNEFKTDANKANYEDDQWKLGGTFSAGFSMFILEILGSYSYYESNQYISINLNVRLPIYINL